MSTADKLSGFDAEGEKAPNPMYSKTDEVIKIHPNAEPEHHHSARYQLCATLVIVAAAAIGLGLGVFMANEEVDPDVISWIALPGDLFIRSLKCVVLPLIFVNVILAVIQMLEAGKAGKVGRYTIITYLLTTLIASIEGLLVVLFFKDQFREPESDDAAETYLHIQCPSGEYLAEDKVSGNVFCSPKNSTLNDDKFYLDDLNGVFETTASSGFEAITFSQTLQNGIFKKAIPDNITAEFANGNFVGVIVFAIVFGVAAQSLKKIPDTLIQFLNEVNDILVKIIQWIIYLTPVAVFSLIAGAIGGQQELDIIFQNIGVLVMASVIAFMVHVLVVYPALFLVIVKKNPYAYLRHIIPAQVFAFACASSAATLPVTLRCVKETGQVPDSIRNFVLPIGATINMDGTSLYFPPALVFLAVTAGQGSELNFSTYLLIVIVSTIGSAGAAPVPNAGLVLIITAYNTVFGGEGEPANFFIIVAIDWLMDRFQTSLNITGDAMVSRIVTHLSGSDIVDGTPTSQLSIVGGDEDI
mmetsp:Transcript_18429/g.24053  ORF Transcript_18429/g.24053 Transcript_18429/m.24053 type:complete len:526 (+) Transcript_18429:65-1642(+)